MNGSNARHINRFYIHLLTNAGFYILEGKAIILKNGIEVGNATTMKQTVQILESIQ